MTLACPVCIEPVRDEDEFPWYCPECDRHITAVVELDGEGESQLV